MTIENNTISIPATYLEYKAADYVVLIFSLSMVAGIAVLMHLLH